MTTIVELRHATRLHGPAEDIVALDRFSVAVEPGEFVALTGPSGSGKTTALSLLGLLDVPTSGEVLFGGQRTAELSRRKRRQIRSTLTGFVFQSFHLVAHLTAAENAAFGLRYARRRDLTRQQTTRLSADALDRVGLGHRSDHLPSELSGGERQRVAIARALIHRPQLLLADEPTGNLDLNATRVVLDLLHQLNSKGETIVVVTHDPTVAREATRIVEVGPTQ